MWAVMKALPWDAMDTSLFKFKTPEVGTGEPQRFIPLFDMYEDALTFANGNTSIISEMKTSVMKEGGDE